MLSKRDYLTAEARYRDPRTDFYLRRRCHALLLCSDGYSPEEAAEIVRVEVHSVWRWCRQYQRDGWVIESNGWGGEHGQRWLDDPEQARLDHLLRTEAPPHSQGGAGWRRQEIAAVIEQEFGVRYRAAALRKLLHQMHWSYQRGRAVYVRRDEAEVAAFHRAVKKTQSLRAQRARGASDSHGPVQSPSGGDRRMAVESGGATAAGAR